MSGDFIESQGRAFFAHRLRRSSDRIVEQVGAKLLEMGLSVPPRGASMLLLLDEAGPLGVMEISRRIRLSHPLMVRMARQFEELGLVTIHKDPEDSRRKQLVLSEKARTEAKAIRAFNDRLAAMYGELFAEIGVDVIAVLDRLDAALIDCKVEQRLSHLESKEPTDE